VVQLEVLLGDEWVAIVRYDMAHGVPHVDRYDTPKARTKELLMLSPESALTFAGRDVDQNWRAYRDAFRGRNRE
jgi:hypothetical protein